MVRIRDVYSLPVAPLVLHKCSSVFDVHTIDLEPRGQQVQSRRIFPASVFACHCFHTVQVPFYNHFDTVFFYCYVTVFRLFTVQRKRNGNFILTPTCLHVAHVDVTWNMHKREGSECIHATCLIGHSLHYSTVYTLPAYSVN